MAEGAGGKEVGRISIRVVPNLDKFYRDLEEGLKAADRLEVEIKIKPNWDDFREKVRAETSDLPAAEVKVKPKVDRLDLFQKRMLAELNDINKNSEAKLALDIDGERLRRAFDHEIKALSTEARAKIPVDLEIAADQRAKIAAEIAALRELTRTTPFKFQEDPEADFRLHQRVQTLAAKIKPEVQQTDFEKALAEAKAAAKAAGVKLDVDITDKAAEAHLREMIARMKLEAKAAHIKVDVDVDKKAGASNFLGGLFGGGASAAGGGAGGLGSFADTGALVLAVASIIAPALALVAGAIAALPALLAGVLIPIGAVALGFKGIAEAADAAGLLSEGKKGKQGIGAGIKALQDTLSAKFKDGFTPIFQKLAPLIPALGQGLLPVADGVIKIAQGFTDMVTKVSSLGLIKTIFDNIGRALNVAAPGIASFSEGILKLISGGTNTLPGFATLFGKMGDAVNGWVTKVTTKDFWGTSQLDRTLSNLQTILGKIGGVFGDIFTKSFDMLSDPKFATTIGKFIDDLKTVVDALIPALKDFFSDLSGPFHDLATLVGHLPKGNSDPSKPSPEPGNPNPSGGQGKPFILPEAGANLQTALSFANIPLLIIENWSKLPAFFSGLWNAIVSAANTAGTLVGQALSTAVGAVVDGVVGAATSVGTALQGVWTSIASSASGVWDGIVSAASSAWDQVVQAVQGAVSGIISDVQSAGSQVVGEVASWPGKIAGALAGLFQAGVNAGTQLVQGFIQGIGSLVGAAVAKAKDLASQVTSAVQGALGIKSPSTVFHGIGMNTMQGLQNGLDGGLQGVLDRAKSISQQITDAMTNGTSGIGPGVQDQLKKSLSELGIEHDQLRVQLDQTTDKGQRKAIEDQLKQVQAQRDQLSLQSDQLGFSKKYGDSVDNNTQLMQGMVTKTGEIGKNFAETNVKQFVGDIGGSGNGAVEQIADIGIGFLSSTLSKMFTGGQGQGDHTHYHVNSVDEALTAERTKKNREALQYVDRS